MSFSRDQARRLAYFNAVARCALGAVALTVPSLPLSPWVGASKRDRSVQLLARALGARDLALGLGALFALRHDAPVRGWVEAGGFSDAADAAITLASFRALPRWGRWAVLGAASGGVLLAGLASGVVDRAPGMSTALAGEPASMRPG